MTLAVAFEAQNLPVRWNLDINHLDDPFVVVPVDPEAAYDMTLVADGLKSLVEAKTTEVPETAIQEAMDKALQARDAAMVYIKAAALGKFPDDLHSPAISTAGWRGMSSDALTEYRDRLASDVFHSAVPIYLEGPAAAAARLGLRTLAERGEPDCDPMRVATVAGEVAVKYSGTQYITMPKADEVYHATVAELEMARQTGDSDEIRRLQHALRWVVDHTIFRY